jgi:hypothetical protein
MRNFHNFCRRVGKPIPLYPDSAISKHPGHDFFSRRGAECATQVVFKLFKNRGKGKSGMMERGPASA